MYFLTMTIVEWIDLFTRPVYKEIITESLKLIVLVAEHYLYSSASNYRDGNGIMEVSVLEDIWDDTGYVHVNI